MYNTWLRVDTCWQRERKKEREAKLQITLVIEVETCRGQRTCQDRHSGGLCLCLCLVLCMCCAVLVLVLVQVLCLCLCLCCVLCDVCLCLSKSACPPNPSPLVSTLGGSSSPLVPVLLATPQPKLRNRVSQKKGTNGMLL